MIPLVGDSDYDFNSTLTAANNGRLVRVHFG
jgi:hypothetical protein